MSDTALATMPRASVSLVAKMADRFHVAQDKLLVTLKATAFKQSGDKTVSNEQMMALLVVADQYGLNPFTKEIFAFDDKHKGIVPIVSVDGWLRIINTHPMLDGLEFRYADVIATMPDARPCPEWCEVVIRRRDRTTPIIVREYLDEVYVGKRNGYAGPWQSHTKRMLRWKALIQGARVAFGFAGIYDEDEAGRIIEGTATLVPDPLPTTTIEQQLLDRAQAATAEDAPPTDTAEAVAEAMKKASTRVELDDAAERISLVASSDERKELVKQYELELARIEQELAG
jgi:phage recombination protein Bet